VNITIKFIKKIYRDKNKNDNKTTKTKNILALAMINQSIPNEIHLARKIPNHREATILM
jgi:hypothetical protein